jgi:hypothetical protein
VALSSRCGAPGRLLDGGEVAAAQTVGGGQARVSGGGRAQGLGPLGFLGTGGSALYGTESMPWRGVHA